MGDSTNPRTQAIAALAELFFESACRSADLAQLESSAIDIGHGCMAEALGLALEALDARLLAQKPEGIPVHDVRSRTLATEIGDVGFSLRRYRDRFGEDVYLLADALDIPYGCRISPGAQEFLVQSASLVSCAKAAKLLARHGSSVKATSVMRCLRDAGALCAADDEKAAREPYRDGVLPGGETCVRELCMEADGTYFRAQGLPDGAPKRFEVKAMCAYAGKEAESGKVRRRGTVRHALAGRAGELWSEGVAAVGKKYDLAKIEHVHLGADGERWCRDAGRFLPNAEVTFHLDPFHVNHAIMGCFADAKLAWGVIDALSDGDTAGAVCLLGACADLGIARKSRADAVVAYLEGNAEAIAVEGPSLGTMESENQHLYGARMDALPCAWSLTGASDMARIISRRESKTPVPKMSREASRGEKRRARRDRKELSFYGEQGLAASKVLESSGSGYLPPHQADTRKMDPGKAYALHKGMAILDRGI